jgi:hypothetical protein
MGKCLEISNYCSILALLMRLSTLKHKKMKNLTKKEISNRINWLDPCMSAFQAGYGKHLWDDFNKKMEQGLYPGLVFPVVCVLFGDENEKLGKDFHKFIENNMEKASIANKFAIDKELKSYSKFYKSMIWFANEYMIQMFDSLDSNSKLYVMEKFNKMQKLKK